MANGKKPYRKVNRLTICDAIRLAEWIRAADLTNTTTADLARSAESELGVRITDRNVEGALKTTGLSIITPLEQDEDQHARDIATVAKIVADLLDELGHPVPESLANIAGIEV